MNPFGGLDLELLADVIGTGYATWIDPDPTDRHVRTAHGARVVQAPIETVYDATTDFRALSDHVSLLGDPDIRELDDDRVEVRFRAKIGLAVLSLDVGIGYRFRRERPVALHMEEYLGGAFERSELAFHFHVLDADRTLMIMSFTGDIRSLPLIGRVFLSRIPELEVAIEGNMLLIPLMAMSTLAERRSGAPRPGPTLGDPLQDRLTEVLPALEHGLLTVARIGANGDVSDVCSASRIAASPERVWDLVRDPAKLARVVSFVEGGRIVWESADRQDLQVGYKARLGPLRKRYRIQVRAEVDAPTRLHGIEARTDGVPSTYGDYLLAHEGGCIYAHRFATDPKRDWLSRAFLKQHPELERLIAQYPPAMQVWAVRKHLGGPTGEPR